MVIICSNNDWHEVIVPVTPGVRLLGVISNDDCDETPWFRIKIWVLDKKIAEDKFEYWNYQKRDRALKQFRFIRGYTDFVESEYGDINIGEFYTDGAADDPDAGDAHTTMKVAIPSFNKLLKEIADMYTVTFK